MQTPVRTVVYPPNLVHNVWNSGIANNRLQFSDEWKDIIMSLRIDTSEEDAGLEILIVSTGMGGLLSFVGVVVKSMVFDDDSPVDRVGGGEEISG